MTNQKTQTIGNRQIVLESGRSYTAQVEQESGKNMIVIYSDDNPVMVVSNGFSRHTAGKFVDEFNKIIW